MSVLLIAIGGKPEYTGGLQLVLLAAGSVVVAEWAKTTARRSLAGTALVCNAVMSAVLMLPILPIAVYGSNPVLKQLGVFQLDQAIERERNFGLIEHVEHDHLVPPVPQTPQRR